MLVHLKFTLPYSDAPHEMLHNLSSEDGISAYYDVKTNRQICEVIFKSTEVCKQVLYRIINIVNRVRTVNSYRAQGNALWTRELLK